MRILAPNANLISLEKPLSRKFEYMKDHTSHSRDVDYIRDPQY